MNVEHAPQLECKRILVLVNPDKALAGDDDLPAPLARAVAVARSAGSTIELFHACHEPTLDLHLFADQEEIARERQAVLDRAATSMAELALRVERQGVEVAHEVRWDQPGAEAILSKVADSGAEIVFKASEGPSFILGLATHGDWELLRRSPAHLWFVKDQNAEIETVLTAVGGDHTEESVFSTGDYDVFDLGGQIARLLGAQNLPVHTYQVPRLYTYTTYAPAMAGAANVPDQTEAWENIARTHGDAISKFARHFDIDPEKVHMSRGHPAEVLPDLAESLDAGLIVMGARNLGRWERLFSSVSAEPVLSEAPCDVLFIKDGDGLRAPKTQQQSETGVPSFDLEVAITAPEKAFSTPQAVAEAEELTPELRQRILDAWEHDLQAELRHESEGGPAKSGRTAVLDEISAARRNVASGEPAARANA